MSAPGANRKVAILGGGMAGMTAAWRLSEPGWEDRFDRITVYQRGWRLGGKGASSRGPHGRIEEHGLHVWLGYYENSFRVVRQIYGELDRAATAPGSPIKTWTDAFQPVAKVGFEDFDGQRWKHWVATFRPNGDLPGEESAPSGPMSVADFVRRSLRLVSDFYTSLGEEPPRTGLQLSSSPRPRPEPAPWRTAIGFAVPSLIAGAAQLVSMVRSGSRSLAGDNSWLQPLAGILDRLHRTLKEMAMVDDRARRLWSLMDLILTTAKGIVADGLLFDPRGFDAINHEDYRDWIRRHGASAETLESALVRGMYDLTFANRDGDPSQPRFGAGTGLFLSGKLFFDYRGSIFWKMNAGMGDVLFAPMYQALKARGVDFEFFTRVDALRIGDDRAITSIELGRQANVPESGYEPLVQYDGLACFPDRPIEGQVGTSDDSLESFWSENPDTKADVLERGRDFDEVVLAIPVGMHPFICADLIEASPEWKTMVNRLGTTATKAFQIWLNQNPTGVPSNSRVTMTGYVEPWDTWSSMDHLLEYEGWAESDRPKSLVYFCDTMKDGPTPGADDPGYPKRRREEVRDMAVAFMDEKLVEVWPSARSTDGGFRWDLLAGAGESEGPGRFDSQYWTANVDPSDRYVLSLPGSDEVRLRPDESGFSNLYLAGDWTDSGLNAGCVEAATISGLQAANAILGRERWHEVKGFYPRHADD